MQSLQADVVVVGAGIAGALAAYELARKGIRVIVLDAGPRITRDEILSRFISTRTLDNADTYPDYDWAPAPHPARPDAYILRDGPFDYRPHYIRAVGGTTWHWNAGYSRLLPTDMQIASAYGLAVDWPISYRELEPYYDQVEVELGVAGAVDLSIGSVETPRKSPYPMPVFATPYGDRIVIDILDKHGIRFRPGALARNSIDYDFRPACHGNNLCHPICPIGAQYAAIVHVEKAEQLGVRVIDRMLATRIEIGEDGLVEAVVVRRPDGEQTRIVGKHFVIAANGIETPRLMLMSATADRPAGVANSSGLVGRYFMDHLGVLESFLMPTRVYAGRGPLGCTINDQFSDGPFRSTRPAMTIGLTNRLVVTDIAKAALKNGLMGKELDETIRDRVARTIEFNGFVEVLPDPNNRVTLDHHNLDTTGLPRVRLRFDPGGYAMDGIAHLREMLARIGRLLNAAPLPIYQQVFGANHLLGTMRMGTDPRHSVVDPECRSHDHPNLFVAGSSVFPTGGGSRGPTPTIAALSLRLAESIALQISRSE